MKQGLLLKEAPEPFQIFNCQHTGGYGCSAVFDNEDSYKKHREEKHGEIYTYILEPEYHSKYANITYPAYFVKRWVKIEESQGRMVAPLDKITRPVRRYFFTKQELENLENKKCFCGKSFKWPRRKAPNAAQDITHRE